MAHASTGADPFGRTADAVRAYLRHNPHIQQATPSKRCFASFLYWHVGISARCVMAATLMACMHMTDLTYCHTLTIIAEISSRLQSEVVDLFQTVVHFVIRFSKALRAFWSRHTCL